GRVRGRRSAQGPGRRAASPGLNSRTEMALRFRRKVFGPVAQCGLWLRRIRAYTDQRLSARPALISPRWGKLPVSDPLIARFADACGATGPLHLRVDLADGGVLAEGSVAQPFTLVGRDDACDVTLSDPEVNLRHAWLQVLGGRVFAVDLGSHSGLVWSG